MSIIRRLIYRGRFSNECSTRERHYDAIILYAAYNMRHFETILSISLLLLSTTMDRFPEFHQKYRNRSIF